ncbi:hypothetical protein C7C46_29665 [Streptomyces tateyamensis]|uniref:Uncharacterized protein n=1 Tax=Streptomyces tateyamensis TaxID=565073 RepID=A0A2V4NIU1_9ACTN|nr:hypothetical protein [Streptomyces tateyamensis]PYC68025.1 hypothetical protein C7C46_29665 [Streptomyces tateyamensis]
MISPCQPYLPSPLDRDPVASLGTWLFVPDRRNAAGDVHTGYLSRNGERVVLAHTSRLLADFMRKVRQLESDFAARLNLHTSSAEESDRSSGDLPCTTG